MNITPIANSSNVISSPLSNNAIKFLENQKIQLQDQIQKTTLNKKLDDKTKQDTIKQLQEQIQQIDMEILQKQNERLNKDTKNNSADSQTSLNNINDESAANSLSSITMTGLIQATSSYSDTKLLKNAKNKLLNNKQVIKTEIKLDGFTTNYKELNLENIDANIKSLDGKFRDSVQTTQEHLKESAKHEHKEKSNPISEENNTKTESDLSTSSSKDPGTQNIELPLNGKEVGYKNLELKEKRLINSKVDINV